MPNMPATQYKAFSGANIFATIGNRRVGSLQALTVSITREVAALYSFSDANPKAFVKGKRGIAGTLVFTQFDRHALLRDVFENMYGKDISSTSAWNSTLLSGQFAGGDTLINPFTAQVRNWGAPGGLQVGKGLPGTDVPENIQREIKEIYDLVGAQKTTYSDQLPEFDITVTMVNEAGDAAFCVIGGVVLVNEGWGYTLDDLTSEVAFTYVARSITPLASLTNQSLFDSYQKAK
jgi:hypothetical protein